MVDQVDDSTASDIMVVVALFLGHLDGEDQCGRSSWS
jgi:hypothetical protein